MQHSQCRKHSQFTGITSGILGPPIAKETFFDANIKITLRNTQIVLCQNVIILQIDHNQDPNQKYSLRLSHNCSEWVSSFLTAHQHTSGYLVPYNDVEDMVDMAAVNFKSTYFWQFSQYFNTKLCTASGQSTNGKVAELFTAFPRTPRGLRQSCFHPFPLHRKALTPSMQLGWEAL